MVRVGGGWQALEEFLLKNDPCRGKSQFDRDKRLFSVNNELECVGPNYDLSHHETSQ